MKRGGRLWTMLRSFAVLEPGIRMRSPKRLVRTVRVALDMIPAVVLEPVQTSAATGGRHRRVEKFGQHSDDNRAEEDAAKEH